MPRSSNTPEAGVPESNASRQGEPNRGRGATEPEQIPAPGWWDIVLRVNKNLTRDHVSLVAGGLAMHALLAVFPALAAAVSLYGWLLSPSEVIKQMSALSWVLPPGVWAFLNTDLQQVANHDTGTLTFATVIALLIALISARSGMASLLQATNIAYQEREKRGFIRQVTMSLLFTLGAIFGFVVMLVLGVAVPLILSAFTSIAWLQTAAAILRWVLLWAFAVMGLAVIYRYAPAREYARWRWVTWGSVIAATLWIAGSVLFTVYVRTLGSYTKTYGALAGVVVLLIWFYLSSYLLILGAEIDAEMERQTARDTTEGPEVPMGQRGAYVADTVGPSALEMKQTGRND